MRLLKRPIRLGLCLLVIAGCGGRGLGPTDSAGHSGANGATAGTGGDSGTAGAPGGGASGTTAGTGGTSGTAGEPGAGGASGATAGTGGTSGTGGGSGAGGTGGSQAPCPTVAGMTMVRVPAGYCIDTTEVTRAQYAAWLATAPSTAGQSAACTSNSSFEANIGCMTGGYICAGVNCGNHPQICIDWCDASAYCRGAGKRLCGRIGGGSLGATTAALSASDSEWVHACTAGGSSDWPYGSTAVAGRCNMKIDSLDGTVPVGSLTGCTSSAPGFSGIFDMVGNVWEFQDACAGTAGLGDMCVLRGGSFDLISSVTQADRGCGTSYTYNSLRGNTNGDVGFRCCAD